MKAAYARYCGYALLIAATMLVAQTAMAASSAPTNVNINAADAIVSLYDGFMDPIKAFGNSLRNSGQVMIFALVTIHVAAGALMYAGGSMDPFDLLLKGVMLSLSAGLVYAAVVPSAWLGYMTGLGGSITLPDAITAGFRTLSGRIGSASSGDRLLADVSANLFGAVFDNMSAKIINQEWTWTQILQNFVGVAMSLLFWFGSLIMFVIAAAVVLGEALAADIGIQLALAFTGLMVPWALFPPMRFLFDAWLKTFLIGNVGLLIASLFAAGMQSFARKISTLTQGIDPEAMMSNGTILSVYAPVLLGSLILIVIAGKTTQFASSLMSGGGMSGLSLKEFARSLGAASMASKAPGQAGREISGRLQSAGSTGLQGMRTIAGSLRGGIGGFRNTGGSFGARMNAAWNGASSSAGLSKSPGGKAAAAIAQNRNKPLNSPEVRAAAIHGNKVFREALRSGEGRPAAYAAMNRAVTSNLESARPIPKPAPATPPPAGPAGARP